jgi:protocatechuate 4,5-dioxygenase, alpha chain
MSTSQHPELNQIPGTIVFTGELCRKGYALNQFCMSLMRADNRARFKADESGYLGAWALSEAQIKAVLARDYQAMLELGGNIFYILKIGATDGRSVQSIVASIAGQSPEDYAAMMLAGGRQFVDPELEQAAA